MLKEWVDLAFSRSVIERSIKVSLIVGTLIGLINYSDKFFSIGLGARDWFKICVTYLVPFAVSNYAAVSAILALKRQLAAKVHGQS